MIVSCTMKRLVERKLRMGDILLCLKDMYGEPKTELHYKKPHELLFAVMLSAQCTDARVNMVTKTLFKNYATLAEYATASQAEMRTAIASISYPNNKAQHIRETAQILLRDFKGKVPSAMEDLLTLKGVARKTANVVRGELYDVWDGIAIDTHVKRFVKKFDLSDATTSDGMEKDLMLLNAPQDWKYVNNGLVLYGRYVCKAIRHDCGEHPLTTLWPPAGKKWPKAS